VRVKARVDAQPTPTGKDQFQGVLGNRFLFCISFARSTQCLFYREYRAFKAKEQPCHTTHTFLDAPRITTVFWSSAERAEFPYVTGVRGLMSWARLIVLLRDSEYERFT